MKKRSVTQLQLLMSVVFLFSCSNQREKERLTYLKTGFENSTKKIEQVTLSQYRELKNKLADPLQSDRAIIWLPRATYVRELTTKVLSEIDSLQSIVKTGTVASKQLSDKLQHYRESVLAVDPEVMKNFTQDTIESPMLENASEEMAIVLLSKTKSDIRIFENKVIDFCTIRSTPGCMLTFDVFSAIVAQNTHHLRAGEKLTITAGVGAFSTAANPKITINGARVVVEEDAVATYELKATGPAGKYSLPVKIEYINPDGLQKVKNVDVQYSIDN